MTNSQFSADDTNIPIPIITNNQITSLITSIQTNAAGLTDKNSLDNITKLIYTLSFLSKNEPASPLRSFKIYSALLTLALIDNTIEQHKRNKKNENTLHATINFIISDFYTRLVSEVLYPEVLIAQLLSPAKTPLTSENQHKLQMLITELKSLGKKYHEREGNQQNLQAEIYAAVITAYVECYIYETSKNGHKLLKGPLLSHLEETLKDFTKKTGVTMFIKDGEQIHDRILKSIETTKDDSPEMKNMKRLLLRKLTQNAFNIVTGAGLDESSDKNADYFLYAYNAIEKMGNSARVEFNLVANQHTSKLPTLNTLDLGKQKEKVDKKFSNLLAMRENTKITDADVLSLFQLIKSLPELRALLRSKPVTAISAPIPAVKWQQQKTRQEITTQPSEPTDNSLSVAEILHKRWEELHRNKMLSLNASNAPSAPTPKK